MISITTDFGKGYIAVDKILIISPQRGKNGAQVMLINGMLLQCAENPAEVARRIMTRKKETGNKKKKYNKASKILKSTRRRK